MWKFKVDTEAEKVIRHHMLQFMTSIDKMTFICKKRHLKHMQHFGNKVWTLCLANSHDLGSETPIDCTILLPYSSGHASATVTSIFWYCHTILSLSISGSPSVHYSFEDVGAQISRFEGMPKVLNSPFINANVASDGFLWSQILMNFRLKYRKDN